MDSAKVLDSVMDDLLQEQGVDDKVDREVRRKTQMTHLAPLHAILEEEAVEPLQVTQTPWIREGGLKKEVATQEVATQELATQELATQYVDTQDVDTQDVSWSIWGMWSECTVSCDKGAHYRQRQCIRRKEDTFDGERVKTSLCPGKRKDKKSCRLFPCPISVAIPRFLAQLNEGQVGRLSCQNHQLKGKIRFRYWITPTGETVTNSSADGKYEIHNDTLTIQQADRTDLGRYLCVLVGSNQAFMPGMARPPGAPGSSVGNATGEKKDEEEEHNMCIENPCANDGTCEEVMDIWSHTHGYPLHYRCLCPIGFFGKHCEQKSLVHKYKPNLKVMGFVLVSLIIALIFTSIYLFAYYCCGGKMEKADFRPIMTRRRSEDEWRKMKSFDKKARASKKKSAVSSFSTKSIKKRLSRMWSGQSDKNEDKQPPVNFGMDSSWQSLNDKTDITITSHRPSEDVSQNASPSTVDEDASECESLTEPQDDQRCLSSLPHSERHRAPIQDNHKQHSKIQENQIRHNEFQDRQRHFPDFQDSHTELEDSQRNAVDYPDNQGCQAELEDSRGHSGEFKDTHPRHHTKLPDIQRRQPRFPENPNHVIIELQDSRLYVDFLEGHQRLDTRSSGKQGPDAFPRKSCSEPQTSHRQRAQAQSHPTIIYSDDKMEMFSDSNLLSMQDREEGGMKMDPFSPSLDRPAGSGHPDPSTYIYRSRSDCGKASLPQSAPASTSSHHRAKRKRRAKKWPRLSPSLQFNQNNSDDSNDGSSQPSGDRTDSEGEGAEGTPQSPSHPHPSSHALPSSSERGHGSASSVPGEKGHHSASSWPGERGHHSASSSPGERGHHSASSSPGERRHPNASSSAGERGQWCADRYSSTDSGGEEGCDGGQGSSVRQRGARPKVRSRSWHRAREYISRTSTPHNSPMWPQLDRGGFGTSSRTDLTGTLSPLLMYKMYEVRHPDEPYPFRMARSHRKMQERSSTSGQPHPNDYPHPNDHSHPNDHPRPNDHSRPNDHPYPNDHSRTPACVEMLEGNTSANGLGQDTESVTACAQPSSDTASHPPHQPSTTSPPHPLRHLEGGGEGASATVRADSRKSGRDVLLRRAMENSYILATTGREAFHSSPHGLPSTAASLDAGLSQVSDQAARSGAAPSSPQGAVGMRTEGLWGEPSGQASVGPSCRRKDQQGGADPSAVPAPSPPHTQRTLLGRKLLDLTPAPLSSTAPRPHAFPYTLSGLHLPAHTASQQGTSSTQEEGIQHSLADSMDSTGWTRVLKEKAGDSSGRQCPWPVSPCGASQLPSPLCALDPARGTSQERRVKLTGEGGVEDGAGRTSGVWRPVSLIAHTQWEAAGCQLPHGPVDTGIPQSSDSRGQVPSPSAPSPGPSRLVKQDTCSLPECRSPKQSMLKSAMKQQGGRLCPDVESSAQTPRRVSFSEHHIHIRNSLDCVLDSGGQREVGVAQCSSDTGLGRGVESATSGCCDPLRERDAHRYGDARSDPTCGRLEAGSRGFTQAFSSSSTSANTPQLSALPAFSGAELRWPWHDAGGYPDSLWHRSLPLSTHPPHRQEAAGYPSTRTEVWVPEKSSACPGREASRPSSPTPASHTSPFVGPRGRAREGVLVDIEPHTLSPLQGDLMDSAGRLSPPVRLQQSGATPLYSNLLLTPLTPQPAVDIPTLAGVHSTQEHRHSTQEPGDGGRRVTEAPTHHATGGRVTPAEPNLPQGGLSLRSFQEMLAARSPGAFFRPIDPTEKSGEPED